jgi:TRAP-type C4-dicarboxylate transport system permease small subunit
MSFLARTARAPSLRRIWRWAARGLGVGLAALLCIGSYFWFSTPLPAPERLRERAALGSTRILDRRG